MYFASMSILDGELAAEVTEALADVFLPATVTRMLPGSTDPPYAPWNPGPPTPQNNACLGIVDDYAAHLRDGTLIQQTDRKVLILANSLAITPTTEDTCTIRGATGAIIRVSADPALATYELQVRF